MCVDTLGAVFYQPGILQRIGNVKAVAVDIDQFFGFFHHADGNICCFDIEPIIGGMEKFTATALTVIQQKLPIIFNDAELAGLVLKNQRTDLCLPAHDR